MKAGWKYKKLGEVVTFDKRFKGVDRSEQRQVVSFSHVSAEELKLMAIEDGNVKLLATGLFEGYTSEEIAGDNLCEGEVITIPTGGNANIKYYQGKFVDSGNILAIVKNANTYLKFVWYYLLYKNAFLESCYKGTSIKHPFMPDIWELLVPIPDIFEQRFIVSCLDTAFAKTDALKANAEKQLAEARQLFQAELAECMRPKEGWEEKPFIEVCDIITDFVAAGSFADLRKNVIYNDTPDYAQLVRTTDLKHDFENKSFVYVSKHAFDYLWRVNLNEESIVLPNVGVNCGEVYFVNPNKLPYKYNVLGPNAIMVRSHKYDNLFLSYLFKGEDIQTQLRHITSSMAQPKYNKTNLKKLIVHLPSLEIQHSIVSRLDALSANIKKMEEVQRKTLAECDALKQAMLKEVFE